MPDIAIGVIGAGGMGSRHAINLHHSVPGACVVGIYDLNQQQATRVATDCGSAKPFSDPIQLIQDSSVEAVLIASPDPTHAAFVHACLHAQKPVLCEKPLATTAADALSIVEAEKELGKRMVALGFMRRFDPQHLAVKQAADAGKIGRPILFKGVHRNPMPAPQVTGAIVITNSAIHDIDSSRWMLGQDISDVYVRGVRSHASFSPETVDMLLLQMTLTNDCMATIECSVAVEYGYEVSAELVGERGAAITAQPDNVILRSSASCGVAVPYSHLDRFQSAFLPELTDWIASLQAGRAFGGASAWDGYMSLLVAEACIQSLHSGRPVSVARPACPELYTYQA